MSSVWRSLLAADEERVLPWLGSRRVHDRERGFRIVGELPLELGWYRFRTSSGRDATVVAPADPDPGYEDGRALVRGYLAGERLIADGARVDPAPERLVEQTRPVFLVERGLERFTRAVVAVAGPDELVYLRQELPEGPEAEVDAAYVDRRPSLAGVAGVTPGLDLAFRWLSLQRRRAEEREARRREEERRREESERLRREIAAGGDGAARRALARIDFAAAARQALALSGAELLDLRPAYGAREMIVRYRFRRRRFECVVERASLRITDAGICLTDHATGERGDGEFTLESLPSVVGEAIDDGALVVYRHV